MWYSQLKFAQIWNVSYSDNSLTEMITALYELTYKFNMMNHPYHDFNGTPQRFDNIINNIKSNAKILINKILQILYEVFEHWLDYHALLSPRTWAIKRLEQHKESFGDDVESYIDFLEKTVSSDPKKIIYWKEIIANLDDMSLQGKTPELDKFVKKFKTKVKRKSNQDLKNYINNMSIEEIYYTYFNDNHEQFLYEIAQNADIDEVMIEIAASILFASWYRIWQPQGIDQTRARVENSFALIKRLPSLSFNESLAAINIIINTAHQTGGMTDYIVEKTRDNDQELLQTLSNLSNQTDFTDWDNDLRSVGLKI